MSRVRVVIHGRVQGVWFRGWTIEAAQMRGLSGWVRNRRDGTVEAVFDGPDETVADMIDACWQGPPAARVDHIDREALSAAVGRTLEALPEGGAVEVSLAPSDLETVQRGEGSEWMPDWGRHATFRADETLQPGDMRAVATQTRVDARVVDLVARLCEELEDVIEAPQEESP